MAADADGAEFHRRAEARRQVVAAEQREFAIRQFTGEAGDGTVQITVDGTGQVRAVHVDPHCLRTIHGAQLGQNVLAAVRAARASAELEASAMLERLLGAEPAGVVERLGNSLGLDRETP